MEDMDSTTIVEISNEPQEIDPSNEPIPEITNEIQEIEKKTKGSKKIARKEFSTYGRLHKIILQALMTNGISSKFEIKRMMKACIHLKLEGTEEGFEFHDLAQVLVEINKRIRDLNCKIEKACHEFTGEYFYIFALTEANVIQCANNIFSKQENEVYEMLFNKFLESENFLISQFDILTFNFSFKIGPNESQRMEMERIINKLIACHYLSYFDEEYLTFGVRTLIEFESYFIKTFDGLLVTCAMCNKTILHSVQCKECGVHVHRSCLKKYMEAGANMCINHACGKIWIGEKFMIVRLKENTFPYKDVNEVTPTLESGKKECDEASSSKAN